MSMTREEAIKTFEDILQLSPTLAEAGCSVTEAMKVALTALRPVSREQAEKAGDKYEIREICGDWALDIHWGKETIMLFFNSRNNAELVKAILEWEDAHPNAAVPYKPAPTLSNEAEKAIQRLGKFGKLFLDY